MMMNATARCLALLTLVVTLFAAPAVASAATYYVATTGSDNNPGSVSAPWRTIRVAVSRLSAGDTLYIRGGVYTGYTDNIDSQSATVPSGTSWANAITISGYPGETATLQPPDWSPGIRLTTGAPSYLIFQDFTIDMSRQLDDFNPAVQDKPEAVYVSSGTHHIRFQRLDIGYTMSNAIQWSTNGAGPAYSSYLELLDSTIHHAGQATGDSGHGGPGINNGYGIYMFTDDNVLAGNEFHSNCAIGINSYGSRNVFKNNTVHNNGTRGGPAPAMNLGSSSYPGMTSDNLIYNNLFVNNRGGVQIYTNTQNTGLYNNTIYGNQLDGLHLQYFGSVTVRNNIIYGNGTDLRNDGGATVAPFDHNLMTAPSFVSIANGDFSLQAGSAAIDGGTTVAEVTTDITGASRPSGGAFDIGAFERGGSTALQAPKNLRVVATN